MTDINNIFVLIILITNITLVPSSNLTSDIRNVSAILNDLLKSYDRYHRPTYGGMNLFELYEFYLSIK